ncbi:30S ribosomal protein S19 [Candidatus Vidania fulgoroideae]|uniref:Small ribosomal subunit protein uS19 n=1 Tax=Candidatus Vidania fulgoroideorum TaxID=881286 RepID=A0A975ADN8_9PROT|nr:30S ribosomal protein S19 [Candidatus Vidania fulgoroideae]
MKIPFCDFKLLKKINKFYLGQITEIRTWARSSIILPRFVGLTIFTHNGKVFIPVTISENMIGHKLGEFAITRKFGGHPHTLKHQNRKR